MTRIRHIRSLWRTFMFNMELMQEVYEKSNRSDPNTILIGHHKYPMSRIGQLRAFLRLMHDRGWQ